MIDIWLIDAFTSEPFKCNPAGVSLFSSFPDASVMQNIAMEMNQAETAFLVRNKPLDYQLRWFTPVAEIALCGHATLAAAHYLREAGHAKTGDTLSFHTQSGELRATLLGDGIELDFPELAGKPVSTPESLFAAIPASILACENNGPNYLVEVPDYSALMQCTPDPRIASLGGVGVIVTTNNGVPAGFDFVSRYFAPNYGVEEDPVTGSAHCMLAPYWSKKLGKNNLRALQASRRTGTLDILRENSRVRMAGNAVTTLKGQLCIGSIKKEKAA